MNEIRHGNEESRNEGRPDRPYRYEMDVAHRSILRDDPNASLRSIADTLSISPETVRTHMSLDFSSGFSFVQGDEEKS
jgi:hypothetical protein